MLVGHHYDGNYIHGIPIMNIKGPTMTAAWKELNKVFKTSGAAHEACLLDNEKSKDLLDDFEEYKIVHQLLTPHKHRNNRAERDIHACKAHFKSCLAGTNPNFTLSEWYRLISQANVTVNLL